MASPSLLSCNAFPFPVGSTSVEHHSSYSSDSASLRGFPNGEGPGQVARPRMVRLGAHVCSVPRSQDFHGAAPVVDRSQIADNAGFAFGLYGETCVGRERVRVRVHVYWTT